MAPAWLLFGDGFGESDGAPDGELDVDDDVEVASNEAEYEVVGKVVLRNVVRGSDMVVMRPLLVSVDKVELSVDVTGLVGDMEVDEILLEAVSCANANTRSRRMAIKKRWPDTENIMANEISTA
jgi:hypothetical protein